MKIAIIGSGGVGGYFGGKLARADNEVTFLARGKHLEALQKNGLVIKSIDGDFNVYPINATDKINTIERADLVIMAIKAWQVKEIAKEIKNIMHSESIVLPLQNGILAADELKEVLGSKPVIGGLCRIISKIESPGVINHFGFKPTIVFGELDNSKTDRIISLKSLFEDAGSKTIVADDILAELWKKFISICVSGLLAVTKTTYGELRKLKETRQLMTELFTEIYHLSQKAGIKVEPEYISKIISAIDSFPYDSTASLTRDVWEGKPSEIEYQNGTVLRLAEKYGIDVPINRFVYSCILPMEIKARHAK